MANVQFLNLQASYFEIKSELNDAISRVLNSGWYILGSEVELFELEWAEYCNANYSVSLANGLDALLLTRESLRGDWPGHILGQIEDVLEQRLERFRAAYGSGSISR